MKKVLVLLLLMVSTSVFAWSLFGPKNYDECVLENMKGVSTDTAARLVANSCHEKFKEKEVDNFVKNNRILYYKDGEKSNYYDNSSITRNGNVVTVDITNDYNKLQSVATERKSTADDEFYSYIEKTEFDCGNLTYRTLSTEFKSGHMGDGITRYHIGLEKERKFTKESDFYRQFCMW
jgi:L-cysteine desulfidase